MDKFNIKLYQANEEKATVEQMDILKGYPKIYKAIKEKLNYSYNREAKNDLNYAYMVTSLENN